MKTQVKIKRAEGPTKLCVEKEFETMKEANHFLMTQSSTYPEVGYDKHDFSVLVTDGDKELLNYSGRLDMSRGGLENGYFKDIQAQMINFIEYGLDNDDLSEETQVEYLKSIKLIKELI